MARLNRGALRAGATADLLVLAPAAVTYAALRGTGVITGDAGAAVTAVIGAAIAPFVGGYVAGRHLTPTPLTHGSVAAGLASVAFVVFRLVDAVLRDRPVHAASLVILVILAMSLGLIGGLVGGRVSSRLDGDTLADSGP